MSPETPNARSFRDALEPVIGAVYFSPECHQRYVDLGFDPSPLTRDGVALPDGPAYFCSRGSILGQVSGEVIASAFGVFNPEAVAPLAAVGWAKTDAATIFEARQRGAVDQLERVLGRPDELSEVTDLLEVMADGLSMAGRPLYAGLRGRPQPESDWDRLFRAGDELREFRGDCHNAVWVAAGLSAVEIGLLTELYWRMPLKTYVRSRAWSDEQLDAGIGALEHRGWISDGAFTDAGRKAREALEASTDALCQPVVDRAGDRLGEVTDTLSSWSEAMLAAGAYPAGARAITGD